MDRRSGCAAIGLLGLLFRLADIPAAPAVIGVILSPLMEQQLRRALTLSQGDFTILVSSPFALILWCVVGVTIVLPAFFAFRRRLRGPSKA